MSTLAIFGLAAVAACTTTTAVVLHRRLRAAQARMRRNDPRFLISSLSHELRTPLTAMVGYAEVARQPSIEPERREECLAKMTRSCRQLVRVANDLFDLARLDQDELSIHPVDCRIDDVLDEAARTVRPEADRKGLLVALRVDDDVSQHVRIDSTRVAQVLRLLLENGVKFTRRGHVGVRAEPAPGGLRLRVHDTGPGVAQRAKSGLFQVGRCGDQSDARRHGGLGLGLGLATRLARRMGGSLRYEEARRGGASFVFELPVEVAESQPEPATHPPKSIRSPNTVVPKSTGRRSKFQGRVLLVEDSRDNQLLIRHVLQQFGLEADVAENGSIALRVLEKVPFDLVLMDMQMPVLDGYAATAQLRERGDRIPVIALTAHAFAGERNRCLAAGCDEFLTKPLERDALRQALGRYLPEAAPTEPG